MVGSFVACCARAASGHAATPPRSDMKSRRLIGFLSPVHTLPHRCRNAALCITAKLIVEWQRWVKLRSHGSLMARPVYLQQRTYLMSVARAVECQKQSLLCPAAAEG